MLRRLLLSFVALLASQTAAHASSGDDCSGPDSPTCGITTQVDADQAEAEFHGLIMVAGDSELLNLATHSGTQPGCGDCQWTLVVACTVDPHDNPNHLEGCQGGGGGRLCRPGQIDYRLYLTTDAFTNRLVETMCLGGPNDVVPVGNIAAADVDKYLKDVTPPALDITVQPPNGVLSNLPAYFQANPPANLPPQAFGGPQVTENITITPAHYTWDWGDGSAMLKTDDPGAPYPDGNVTHTYDRSAHLTAALTTEWSATYTINVAGQTFGPYDAAGTVQRTQRFQLVVNRARSHLVSH